MAEWFGGGDPGVLAAAMSARMIFNGVAGAAAFFALPSVGTGAACGVLVALAALAAATMLAAAALDPAPAPAQAPAEKRRRTDVVDDDDEETGLELAAV